MINDLFRSRILRHPKGDAIQTPLLLPSFSSRGLNRFLDSKSGKKESKAFYQKLSGDIDRDHLISAYDIAKGFINKKDINRSHYIVIDSGGFECLPYIKNRKRWESIYISSDYETVINTLPDGLIANFVTFDKDYLGLSIKEQLAKSKSLLDLSKIHRQFSTFLLKPSKGSVISISEIKESVNNMKSFDVIGVTERELGQSISEKIINIMMLRTVLDDHDIQIPIHIFGCLDPIWIVLFYLSGAEIFDGLNWLSYCYWKGGFMRFQDVLLAESMINKTVSDEFSRLISLNLATLDSLKDQLIEFFHTKDLSLFSKYEIDLEKIITDVRKEV